MKNSSSEEKIFNNLSELSKEYEMIDSHLKTIEQKMENYLNKIDWLDDKSKILKIVGHLPQCYLRFRLYERFYELHGEESGNQNEITIVDDGENSVKDEDEELGGMNLT